MKNFKLLFVVLMVMVTTISNAQRYRSGNGADIWQGHHIKVTPIMAGDVFTDLLITDRNEKNMIFCFVGDMKFFFTDGSTMSVKNNAPHDGQDIFTTTVSLTRNQFETLRTKEIDRWAMLFRNGTIIHDKPPTPKYLKIFANPKK